MAFHVRDHETDALVRKLADRRKVGLTDAVKLAVKAEIDREDAEFEARLQRVMELADRVASRPRTGLKADKAFFDELSGD